MPVYEYECGCGQKIERICKLADYTPVIECVCGEKAKQVIGDNFTHRDADIPWMPSAVKVLQPDHELKTKPIETRQQWKRYLKERGLHCAG